MQTFYLNFSCCLKIAQEHMQATIECNSCNLKSRFFQLPFQISIVAYPFISIPLHVEWACNFNNLESSCFFPTTTISGFECSRTLSVWIFISYSSFTIHFPLLTLINAHTNFFKVGQGCKSCIFANVLT